MKPTKDLRYLVRSAQTEFRHINRNRNLSRADRKLLKRFLLERILTPRAEQFLSATRQRAMNAERVAGERLLTARDLETWLKIDAKTIYVYAKQKRIPHIKVGTNIRFPEREVCARLQSHAHSASFPRKREKGGRRKSRRSRR